MTNSHIPTLSGNKNNIIISGMTLNYLVNYFAFLLPPTHTPVLPCLCKEQEAIPTSAY